MAATLSAAPAQPTQEEIAEKFGISSHLSFAMPGHHVWDGAIIENPSGGYALFFSRWPLAEGHEGWIDFSEICRAQGPEPWGPYEFVETVCAREDTDAWDAHNYHNVSLKKFRGRYYLYYTGNRGNGDWWDHRNHQRIGVASADSIAGPWKRLPHPVIDIDPLSWDSLCVANPSVTEMPEGGYLMIYKGVTDGPRPFGSRVLHGLARAEDPAGPFKKIDAPLFDVKGEKFPFEDPCLWHDGTSYRCLMKDMKAVVAPLPCCTVEFKSNDGICWDIENCRLVTAPFLKLDDGSIRHVERLERPHYFSDPLKPCFSFAVKPHGEEESFLVFKPGAPPV